MTYSSDFQWFQNFSFWSNAIPKMSHDNLSLSVADCSRLVGGPRTRPTPWRACSSNLRSLPLPVERHTAAETAANLLGCFQVSIFETTTFKNSPYDYESTVVIRPYVISSQSSFCSVVTKCIETIGCLWLKPHTLFKNHILCPIFFTCNCFRKCKRA